MSISQLCLFVPHEGVPHNGYCVYRGGGRDEMGWGMRNDGSNEMREGCWKWGLRRCSGVVHFHAQSVKDSPMMTIMSVNTEMRGERNVVACSFIMADANMVEQISCTKLVELS